jgi:hypothetical protein
MVLRWEFIPGSTMFLAWSQSRTDFEECSCEFDLNKSFKELFKITPYDILLLKVSYRIKADKLIKKG